MRLQLIVVVASLLVAAPAAAEPNTLSFDTLFYSDNDNVLVVSPQVAAHRALDDAGGEASARVAVDIISAASVDVVSQATSGFTEVRKEVVAATDGKQVPWDHSALTGDFFFVPGAAAPSAGSVAADVFVVAVASGVSGELPPALSAVRRYVYAVSG